MDSTQPHLKGSTRPSTSDGEEWHATGDTRQNINRDRALPPEPLDFPPVAARIPELKAVQSEQQRTRPQDGQEIGGFPASGSLIGNCGERGLSNQRTTPGAWPNDRSRYPDERGAYPQEKGYQYDHSGKPGESLFSKAKKFVTEAAQPHQAPEDRTSRYRRERDEAEEDLQIALTRVKELESLRKQDKSAIDHYVRLLEQESAKVEGHKKSVDAMQENIDNRELFLGPQLVDSEIKLEYNQIVKDISQWSLGFNAGPENISTFRDEHLSEYRLIAPTCNSIPDLIRLVSDKTDKRLFVRGWIALVMINRFFSTLEIGPSRERDIGVNDALSMASRQLEDAFWSAGRASIPYRAFNDWRALSMELLSRLPKNQSTDEQIEREVRTAVQQVMSLVHPWKKQAKSTKEDEGPPQTAEGTLAAIFRRAIQLANVLRRQRAMWSFRFPTAQSQQQDTTGMKYFASMMFDGSCMEDQKHREEDKSLDELRRTAVVVVIAPALYKRGTIQGARYESEEAMSKAIVSIGA